MNATEVTNRDVKADVISLPKPPVKSGHTYPDRHSQHVDSEYALRVLRKVGAHDPAEIRRAMVLAYRKQSHGAGRIPDELVAIMYAEYRRVRSLRLTAAKFNRHARTVMDIFRKRGLPLFPRGGNHHQKPSDAQVLSWYHAYQSWGSLKKAVFVTGVPFSTLQRQFRRLGFPVGQQGLNARYRKTQPVAA